MLQTRLHRLGIGVGQLTNHTPSVALPPPLPPRRGNIHSTCTHKAVQLGQGPGDGKCGASVAPATLALVAARYVYWFTIMKLLQGANQRRRAL